MKEIYIPIKFKASNSYFFFPYRQSAVLWRQFQ